MVKFLNWKKVLCAFLVLTLVVGLVPQHAYADISSNSKSAEVGCDEGLNTDSTGNDDFDSYRSVDDNQSFDDSSELEGDAGSLDYDNTPVAGSGSESDPFIVNNINQLLSTCKNNENNSPYIKLSHDIVVNPDNFNSEIYGKINFSGTFDGCGHTLTHYYQHDDEDSRGALFDCLNDGAVIKNVNFDYQTIVSNSKVSVVAKNAKGHVDVSNIKLTGKITAVNSSFSFAHSHIGAVFATVEENSVVNLDTVENNMEVNDCTTAWKYAGGMIGKVDNAEVNFNNCVQTSDSSVNARAEKSDLLSTVENILWIISNIFVSVKYNNFIEEATHSSEVYKDIDKIIKEQKSLIKNKNSLQVALYKFNDDYDSSKIINDYFNKEYNSVYESLDRNIKKLKENNISLISMDNLSDATKATVSFIENRQILVDKINKAIEECNKQIAQFKNRCLALDELCKFVCDESKPISTVPKSLKTILLDLCFDDIKVPDFQQLDFDSVEKYVDSKLFDTSFLIKVFNSNEAPLVEFKKQVFKGDLQDIIPLTEDISAGIAKLGKDTDSEAQLRYDILEYNNLLDKNKNVFGENPTKLEINWNPEFRNNTDNNQLLDILDNNFKLFGDHMKNKIITINTGGIKEDSDSIFTLYKYKYYSEIPQDIIRKTQAECKKSLSGFLPYNAPLKTAGLPELKNDIFTNNTYREMAHTYLMLSQHPKVRKIVDFIKELNDLYLSDKEFDSIKDVWLDMFKEFDGAIPVPTSKINFYNTVYTSLTTYIMHYLNPISADFTAFVMANYSKFDFDKEIMDILQNWVVHKDHNKLKAFINDLLNNTYFLFNCYELGEQSVYSWDVDFESLSYRYSKAAKDYLEEMKKPGINADALIEKYSQDLDLCGLPNEERENVFRKYIEEYDKRTFDSKTSGKTFGDEFIIPLLKEHQKKAFLNKFPDYVVNKYSEAAKLYFDAINGGVPDNDAMKRALSCLDNYQLLRKVNNLKENQIFLDLKNYISNNNNVNDDLDYNEIIQAWFSDDEKKKLVDAIKSDIEKNNNFKFGSLAHFSEFCTENFKLDLENNKLVDAKIFDTAKYAKVVNAYNKAYYEGFRDSDIIKNEEDNLVKLDSLCRNLFESDKEKLSKSEFTEKTKVILSSVMYNSSDVSSAHTFDDVLKDELYEISDAYKNIAYEAFKKNLKQSGVDLREETAKYLFTFTLPTQMGHTFRSNSFIELHNAVILYKDAEFFNRLKKTLFFKIQCLSKYYFTDIGINDDVLGKQNQSAFEVFKRVCELLENDDFNKWYNDFNIERYLVYNPFSYTQNTLNKSSGSIFENLDKCFDMAYSAQPDVENSIHNIRKEIHVDENNIINNYDGSNDVIDKSLAPKYNQPKISDNNDPLSNGRPLAGSDLDDIAEVHKSNGLLVDPPFKINADDELEKVALSKTFSKDVFKYIIKSVECAYKNIKAIPQALYKSCQSVCQEFPASTSASYNSYAGGFIGYYDGGNGTKTKVTFKNSCSCGSVMAGYGAGGFLAICDDVHLDFENCYSDGSVICTDYGFTPSAGGFVGLYDSCTTSNNWVVDYKGCLNSASVISREAAGGLLGRINAGCVCVNVAYSGCVAGLAGEHDVGGLIGYEDDCAGISIDSCYSICCCDTVSMTQTIIPLSHTPFGFEDWELSIDEDDLSKVDRAGAYIGDVDDTDRINVRNCCCVNGYEPFGRNRDCKRIIEDKSLNNKQMSLDQFYIGAAAYSMNQGITDEKYKFGQVLDDLSLADGNKTYLPVPGLDAPVYKDEFKNYEFYSNFNPRKIDLCEVNIFADSNAVVEPCVPIVGVQRNTSFYFNVNVPFDYVLSSVTITDDTTKESRNLDFGTGTPGQYQCCIPVVENNCSITVNTENEKACKPEGTGSDADPYRITKKAELDWLSDFADKDGSLANANIVLCNDIDYGNNEWKPVCQFNLGMGYAATFDGQCHKIYNINSDSTDYNGFFSGIDGGTVKNLTIEGNMKDSMIAFSVKKGNIINCQSRGTLSSSCIVCGGIAAVISDDSHVENCQNYATINYSGCPCGGDDSVGGIVGQIADDAYTQLEAFQAEAKPCKQSSCVRNSENNGEIKVSAIGTSCIGAGGIVGGIGSFQKLCKNIGIWQFGSGLSDCWEVSGYISQCNNHGTVRVVDADSVYGIFDGGYGTFLGGILGSAKRAKDVYMYVDKCFNDGDVGVTGVSDYSMSYCSGGLVGANYTQFPSDNDSRASWTHDLHLTNSITTGRVGSYSGHVGGVVGAYSNGHDGGMECKSILSKSEICSYKEADSYTCYSSPKAGWDSNVNIRNCYVCKRDGYKTTNSTSYDGTITQINSNDPRLINGELTFLLNGYMEENAKGASYDNDSFGQNIDIAQAMPDSMPSIIKYDYSNSTCKNNYISSRLNEYPANVYYVENSANGNKYSNYKSASLSNEEFTIDYSYIFESYDLEKINNETDNDKKQASTKDIVNKYRAEKGTFNGPLSVGKGDSVTIRFAPSDGCTLTKVIDNGVDVTVEVSGKNLYIIDDVYESHNLQVEFSDFCVPTIEDEVALIKSPFELNWVAKEIATGRSVNAKLLNDIKVSNKLIDEFSIGSKDKPYSGIIDGCGHTISYDFGSSLFGYLGKDAKISNLKVKYLSDKQPESLKAVFADTINGAQLNNVEVVGDINSDSSLAGFAYEILDWGASFTSCVNSLNITNSNINSKECDCAGFVCTIKKESNESNDELPVFFNSCTNKGCIISEYTLSNCAGLISSISNINNINLNVKDYLNAADISSLGVASGMIGNIESINGSLMFKHCCNNCDIKSDSISSGLISILDNSKPNELCNIEFDFCEIGGNHRCQNSQLCSSFIADAYLSHTSIYFNNCINLGKNGDINYNCSSFVGFANAIADDSDVSINFYNCFDSNSCKKSEYDDIKYVNANYFNNSISVKYDKCYKTTEDPLNFSNNEIAYLHNEDVESGFLATQMSNNLSNYNNTDTYTIGQCLDMPGKFKEYVPHINGLATYKIGEGLFSNSEQLSTEKYNVLLENRSNEQSKQEASIFAIDIPKYNDFIYSQIAIKTYIDINPVFSLSDIEINGIKIPTQDKWKDGYLTLTYFDIYQTLIGDKELDYENINNAGIKSINITYDIKKMSEPMKGIDGCYCIYNKNELLWFANETNQAWKENKYLNNGKDKISARIMSDIDLSDANWVPIGKDHNFYGSIIGDGHTISNLHGDIGAFINEANGASVTDLNLNIDFKNSVVGCCIKNACDVYIKNVNVAGKASGNIVSFGGIVYNVYGSENYTSNKEEDNNDFFYRQKSSNKGLSMGSRIFDCTCDVDLSKAIFDNNAEFGGIAGIVVNNISNDAINSVNISNCESNTNFKCSSCKEHDKSFSGGIVGYVSASNTVLQLNNNTNNGNIDGNNCGGMFGAAGTISNYELTNKNLYIYSSHCTNTGNINGYRAAGFGAYVNDAKFDNDYIENYNNDLSYTFNDASYAIPIIGFKETGTITSSKKQAAGVIAELNSGFEENMLVKDTTILGSVTAIDEAGGFFGNLEKGNFMIANSYVDGAVNSTSNTDNYGAFIGDIDSGESSVYLKSSYYNAISNTYCIGTDTSCNPVWEDINPNQAKYNLKSAYNGELCWNLNNHGSDQIFGQIVDIENNRENLHAQLPDIDCGYNVYSCTKDVKSNDEKTVEGYTNYKNSQMCAVFVNVKDSNGKILLETAKKLYYDASIGYDCQGLNFVKYGHEFRIMLNYDDISYIKSSQIQIGSEVKDIEVKNNTISLEKVTDDVTIEVIVDPVPEPEHKGDTYFISNYANLLWLSKQSNNPNFKTSGKTFQITDDIIVSPNIKNSWKPIGMKQSFQGEIDGCGNIIKNMATYLGDYSEVAFIQNARGASIHHLEFTDVDIIGNVSCAGLIFNADRCKIDNVTMSGKLTSAGVKMGGLIANIVSPANVKCDFNNMISNCRVGFEVSNGTTSGCIFGGIVANIENSTNTTISNCDNLSNLYSNNTADHTTIINEDWCGGIVGKCQSHNTSLVAKNCNNFATVQGDRAGGIVAEAVDNNSDNSNSNIEFEDCTNGGHVAGTYCGGILGLMKDVNKSTNLSLVRCQNLSYIGLMDSVLKDAGGLIGYLSDGDIDATIESCMNLGAVQNGNVSGIPAIIIWFGTLALDVFNSFSDYKDFMDSIGLNVAKNLNPIIFAIFSVMQAVSSVVNHVKDALTGKIFIPQYAGGICGQFDNLNSLNMHRVINYAYVTAQTDEDQISTDWNYNYSSSSIDNIYALGDVCENRNHYKIYPASKFKSGEIGFNLQESDKDNKGNWRQVIDNYEYGTPAILPTFHNPDTDFVDARIYKLDANNNEYRYSNFKDIKNTEFRDLTVNFERDDNFDISKKDLAFDANDFAVNVKSSNFPQYDSVKVADGLYQYSVAQSEILRVNIRPVNDFTITDFEIVNSNINTSGNYTVKYLDDGSVDVAGISAADTNDNFKVKYTNNRPHKHLDEQGNVTILKPWNLTDSLPECAGNFYLVNDVELSSEYKTPNGNSIMCLNGHNIKLKDSAYIDVSLESNYELNDCGVNNNQYYYVDDCSNIECFGCDADKAVDVDKAGNKGKSFKDNHGMIYRDSSSNNNDSLFVNYGQFTLDDISIFKGVDESAVDIASESASAKIDSLIYVAGTIDKEATVKPAINVNANIKDNTLAFGKNFNICKLDNVDVNESVYGTGIFFSKNAGCVDLSCVQLSSPIVVDAANDVDTIVLNKNFQDSIINGITADQVFTTNNPNRVICYSMDNDNDSVCLANKDAAKLIKTEETDCGLMNPTNDVWILKGGKFKFNYSSNQFATIANINVKVLSKGDEVLKVSPVKVNHPYGEFVYDDLVFGLSDAPADSYCLICPMFFNFSDHKENISFMTDVNKPSDLPSELNIESAPQLYKLMSDVTLKDTWNVPEGNFILDLNGHALSIGAQNKSVICLDNINSRLTVVDSARTRLSNKHYFKYQNGMFVSANVKAKLNLTNDQCLYPFTLDENNVLNMKNSADSIIKEGDCVCVNGGIITGTNCGPHDVYLFNQPASAINIKAGSFEMSSGSIAGNNSYKLLGGAAVTAGAGSNVHIGSEARICANSQRGDIEYREKFFAGAIASKGDVVVDGSIDNNVSTGYAASAVSVLSGKFVNNGNIKKNYCFADADNSKLDSYGAVYNDSNFVNSGKIIENVSDFNCPGVWNNNALVNDNNSGIYNNVYYSNSQSAYCNFDIYQSFVSEPFDYKGSIDASYPCYVFTDESDKPLTNNWINAKSNTLAYKLLMLDKSTKLLIESHELQFKLNDNNELQPSPIN